MPTGLETKPEPGLRASGGRGCFGAGTMVTLFDGTRRPIERLQPGDQVLAWDKWLGMAVGKSVLFCRAYAPEPVVAITVQGVGEELRVTAKHQFYVRGQWRFIGGVVAGEELTCFDFGIDALRPRELLATRVHHRPLPVFDISVDRSATYFVEGLMVHNPGGMMTPAELAVFNAPGVSRQTG